MALSKANRLAIIVGGLFVLGVPTVTLLQEQLEREQTRKFLWGECRDATFAMGGQINDAKFRDCVDRNVGSVTANVPRIIFRDAPLRAFFAAMLAATIYGAIFAVVSAFRWVRRGS